jgi:2-dehydropantoate 2-reductase
LSAFQFFSVSAFTVSTIAILGSGALGLTYGVRLALAGHDVRFLARSDLPAIRARGSVIARFAQTHETVELRPVAAFATTDEIGPVDFAFVTLKTTANASLDRLLPPLTSTDTAVLTLQNGLGPDEQIASVIGPERVLSGLAIVGATRTAPGEVTVYRAGHIQFGEFTGAPTDRTHRFAALLNDAGIEARVVDEVVAARWRKLVWNVPFNGLAIAAGGLTTDRILADPTLLARARRLMSDVQRVAAAHGIAIDDAFLEEQIAVTRRMEPYRPSSLVDYLAGRAVELESIWGEPLRRAQAKHVAVPELARLYDELKALVRV